MARKGLLTGSSLKPSDFLQAKHEPCDVCIETKHQRHPHPPADSKSEHVLHRVHMDLTFFGCATTAGYTCMATFLDEYTDFSVVRLLKQKSDLPGALKAAVAFFETQTSAKLQRMRSDGGGEYVNGTTELFCAEKGVVHEKSAPYTPEQNGKAERLNRTLKDRIRAMLADANLPDSYWGYAAHYANNVRNVCPSTVQPDTPHAAFHGQPADVSVAHVFGCDAWVHVPRAKRKTLDARSRKGTFLGVAPPWGSQSYYVLVDGKLVTSSDVIFVGKTSDRPRVGGEPSVQDRRIVSDDIIVGQSTVPAPAHAPAPSAPAVPDANPPPAPPPPREAAAAVPAVSPVPPPPIAALPPADSSSQTDTPDDSASESDESDSELDEPPPQQPQLQTPAGRRSQRVRHPPHRLAYNAQRVASTA